METIVSGFFRTDRKDNMVMQVLGYDAKDDTWKVEYQNGYSTWLPAAEIEANTRPFWLQPGDVLSRGKDVWQVKAEHLLLRTDGVRSYVNNGQTPNVAMDTLRTLRWARALRAYYKEEI